MFSYEIQALFSRSARKFCVVADSPEQACKYAATVASSALAFLIVSSVPMVRA